VILSTASLPERAGGLGGRDDMRGLSEEKIEPASLLSSVIRQLKDEASWVVKEPAADRFGSSTGALTGL